MRFHVLAIPHTVTTPEYSTCAFTQKVLSLCAMLTMEGHQVFHYGHEDSSIDCDENVAVTTQDDLDRSYPGHDWTTQGFPQFKVEDPCYASFYTNAIREIGTRKQKGDFLLCPFGTWHKPVADAHPDLIAVESGIGYPSATFARFKVYESYAIMHAYLGNRAALMATETHWYDAVIPNAFFQHRFEFKKKTAGEPYMLFLGRVNVGKGIHIATDLARECKMQLVVAGPGQCVGNDWVKPIGVVGPAMRRELLSNAVATICASTFLEPFCGVQVESFLSGTPVISSDWGAFAEYNKHGTTGYRCRTFEQFTWAVKNIHGIKRGDCRFWGEQFLVENVAPRYTEYFQSVKDIYGGKGWYEPRPHRQSLDYSSNLG
jgi:glycosyltransferase involved in cell wall biosynthesis